MMIAMFGRVLTSDEAAIGWKFLVVVAFVTAVWSMSIIVASHHHLYLLYWRYWWLMWLSTNIAILISCVNLLAIFEIILICSVVDYSFKQNLLTMLCECFCAWVSDLLTTSELPHSCNTINVLAVIKQSCAIKRVQAYFTHSTHSCLVSLSICFEMFEAYSNLLPSQ